MNFAPLAFVDTAQATALLVTKYRERFGRDARREKHPNSPHHDTQTIILRGPAEGDDWFADEDQVDYPILKEWKSARNLLARIRVALAPLPSFQGKPVVFGKAMIVTLKPGGFVDWHVDEGEYAAAHDRVHLCLLPSPGAWLYSGGEQVNPPVGQLTYMNNRVLHSAVNLGPVPRVHLILDVRKPDPE